VTYNGTATVRYNGKPLDARFITEVHQHCGQFTRYAEYYDTSVLRTAFAP
jgi:ketosteroid isomerase-like protein